MTQSMEKISDAIKLCGKNTDPLASIDKAILTCEAGVRDQVVSGHTVSQAIDESKLEYSAHIQNTIKTVCNPPVAKPTMTERVQQLKRQGKSKEEAFKILNDEGY